MILPVTFGAGPAAAAPRPHPEEVAQRPEGMGRTERAAADVGESRVHISPAGAQRAQADAHSSQTASQPSSALEVAMPATAQSALDLAFAAADSNRDGTVTISEQKTYEVRTVRINIQQPADGRPGPAGSGPIRAYLVVNATIAGR